MIGNLYYNGSNDIYLIIHVINDNVILNMIFKRKKFFDDLERRVFYEQQESQ